jgi:hypothetical protein
MYGMTTWPVSALLLRVSWKAAMKHVEGGLVMDDNGLVMDEANMRC